MLIIHCLLDGCQGSVMIYRHSSRMFSYMIMPVSFVTEAASSDASMLVCRLLLPQQF